MVLLPRTHLDLVLLFVVGTLVGVANFCLLARELQVLWRWWCIRNGAVFWSRCLLGGHSELGVILVNGVDLASHDIGSLFAARNL